MSFPRAAGILLHPTSLPSRGGIGDFGPAAYQFVDSLASARQGLWQVLPLGPLGYGNSPYSSISAFAGNPLLISLERWPAAAGSIRIGFLSSLIGLRSRGVRPGFRHENAAAFRGGPRFCRFRFGAARANALNAFVRRTPGGWMISSFSMRCGRGISWRAGTNGRQSWHVVNPRRDGAAREDLADDLKIRSRAAVCFLRTMAGVAALLRGTQDSHRGRCGDLRELR